MPTATPAREPDASRVARMSTGATKNLLEAAAAGRHRRHRPRGPRPRRGREPGARQGRGGRQRGPLHLRALPQRRPAAARRGRHPADRRRRPARSWTRSPRAISSASTATRCCEATRSSPRARSHTLRSLEAQLEAAKQVIGDELERFAENTLEYLRRERHLLTDSPNLPELRTTSRGRHVLVVVRGLRLPRGPAASCAPTSRRCGRSSSASTAAPTRCSSSG